MINDNAYKLERPNEYGVSTTFNLRTIPFQKGGDDEGIIVQDTSQAIQGLEGPMTRAGVKKAMEALNQMD